MAIIARLVVLAAIALIATSAAAAQTVYKSIGPDGSVVYSDHPPADGKVEKVMTFADLPSSPVPEPSAPEVGQSRVSHAANSPSGPKPNAAVVLYAANWCGYCKRAKAYLAQNRIAFQEVDIDTPNGRSWFTQVGGKGIPLLVAGRRLVRGFSPAGYDAFFASR